MKMTQRGKVLELTSESKTDIAAMFDLMEEVWGVDEVEKAVERPKKKRRSGNFNAWKGKHKRPCPTCGKLFVNMGPHRIQAHEGRKFNVGKTASL